MWRFFRLLWLCLWYFFKFFFHCLLTLKFTNIRRDFSWALKLHIFLQFNIDVRCNRLRLRTLNRWKILKFLQTAVTCDEMVGTGNWASDIWSNGELIAWKTAHCSRKDFKKKYYENSHGNFPLARTKELLLAASLTRKIKMRNVIFFTRQGHRSFAVFNCNWKFSSRQESEASERDETS